jgi:mRNA interferase RelE/StbE
VFAPEAVEDLKRLPRVEARAVADAIELHLRHAPTTVSKSRIKRLREVTSPEYLLRADEWRVFYDVAENEVWIRGVVRKADMHTWLENFGERS